MHEVVMDYGALEYVKLNPKAYIVNLHSVTDFMKDDAVYHILNTLGFVYYQKDIYLNFNGYVNLKKISYGSAWENAQWIGDVSNGFAGAQEHAKHSMGRSPLRVFVFVCDSLEKVLQAKRAIRDIFKIGNFSVHINDTHNEAIALAQTFFNSNSLEILNCRPFWLETKTLDNRMCELIKLAKDKGINIDNICGAGSTPLNVCGLRESEDFDFLCSSNIEFKVKSHVLSNHDSELAYYPYSKDEIINDPRLYFYYNGLKFISLDVLYLMKQKRNEQPKDVRDCHLIKYAKVQGV